ncbi:MAG: M1 family metallopeptidase [Thiotrichales bacterium]
MTAALKLRALWTVVVLLSGLFVSGAGVATEVIHHDLDLRLDPAQRQFEVRDRITLPEASPSAGWYEFGLHRDLRVLPEPGAAPLQVLSVHEQTRFYQIPLAPGQREIVVTYTGQPPSRPVCDWLTERCALFGPQGVYLDGASVWYPRLTDELVSFSLRVRLPEGWHSVSQGAYSRAIDPDGKPRDTWRIDVPQEDIYLVAGPFHVYEKPGPQALAKVYLREPDPALAQRYLDVTADYLARYSKLLGDYPYPQFAAVESFWETGWGMPSFTLLGPRVIRLPFILHSSYPHEILHNWWGNSVYLDPSLGNWSEGLTAYLADHAIQDEQGQGAAYRRAALQKYADYVRRDQETTLRQFRSRHSDASQAIGYQKAMMMWHMLRRELGDEVFFAALRAFYQAHRYRLASFVDLQRAFETAHGDSLNGFFAQWLERAGAPQLALDAAEVEPRAARGWQVRLSLRQTQSGPPYRLPVPYRVLGQDGAIVASGAVTLDQPEQTFMIETPAAPATLLIDPDFDVFRRLDPGEQPASLGQLFGAERVTVVLPSRAAPELRAAYRALAEAWRVRYPGLRLIDDDAAQPPSGTVWVLGWENRYFDAVEQALGTAGAAFADAEVTFRDETFPRRGHSFVAGARRDDDAAWGWLASTSAAALQALGSRITHYGKYGYLVFADADGSNRLKGEWTAASSPLIRQLASDHRR